MAGPGRLSRSVGALVPFFVCVSVVLDCSNGFQRPGFGLASCFSECGLGENLALDCSFVHGPSGGWGAILVQMRRCQGRGEFPVRPLHGWGEASVGARCGAGAAVVFATTSSAGSQAPPGSCRCSRTFTEGGDGFDSQVAADPRSAHFRVRSGAGARKSLSQSQRAAYHSR